MCGICVCDICVCGVCVSCECVALVWTGSGGGRGLELFLGGCPRFLALAQLEEVSGAACWCLCRSSWV